MITGLWIFFNALAKFWNELIINILEFQTIPGALLLILCNVFACD